MTAEQIRNASIPVAAPIDSNSFGKGGAAAAHSVVRVVCPKEDSAGTAFLHKSGHFITADHVVRGCSEIFLLTTVGAQLKASLLAADDEVDLALLVPDSPVAATALPIAIPSNFIIGTQVSTWGFPGGYCGHAPMLSVGHLSGIDALQVPSGKVVRQWVVNAAFNRGNSGGPLLHVESGRVMGVVSSKLAPISPTAKSALDALTKQGAGFVYQFTRPDGSQGTMSEGQVVALVLDELRKQVQLVIGKAVMLQDLTSFLLKNGVDP